MESLTGSASETMVEATVKLWLQLAADKKKGYC